MFGGLQLVCVAQADEREVLGQARDLRARSARLAQQATGGEQVLLDQVTRSHLYGGDDSHLLGYLCIGRGGL